MRPVYDMLAAASRRQSLHMPGHKGSAPFGPVDAYALDTTELPVTDDLYCPENALREAEFLYAKAAGAAETLFLHNGSTSGIHVMVQLYAGEGDTVILPRNAHLSAANGCIIGGVKAVWIPVTQLPDGYCYVAEKDVLAALEQHPKARAVLLTRPDYYGGCMPLRRIVEKAHSLDIKVVVDEAHGAHLPWLNGIDSAGAAGADAWTQSVHKTLPGFTGSAVLHLKNADDRARAMRLLRREQTSSPSFLLMLSIDDARAYMEERGAADLAQIACIAEEARRALPEGYADAHEAWLCTGQQFDPTRLVIDAPQGGSTLAQMLQQRGIDVEMSDIRRIVLILTGMDDRAKLAHLVNVLRNHLPEVRALPVLPDVTRLPQKAIDLRPAAMAETALVPLDKAAGRIAAAPAGLYPPGIPLVCPGEIISDEVIGMLRRAGDQQRFGVEGDCLLCVNG